MKPFFYFSFHCDIIILKITSTLMLINSAFQRKHYVAIITIEGRLEVNYSHYLYSRKHLIDINQCRFILISNYNSFE